jgi:hypothetical protein
MRPLTKKKDRSYVKEKRSWDDSVMLTKHNMEWGKIEADSKNTKKKRFFWLLFFFLNGAFAKILK